MENSLAIKYEYTLQDEDLITTNEAGGKQA